VKKASAEFKNGWIINPCVTMNLFMEIRYVVKQVPCSAEVYVDGGVAPECLTSSSVSESTMT